MAANILEKTFINKQLGFELTSYIDNKFNVWFRGKDVSTILGYKDTNQAIRKHVDSEGQKSFPVVSTGYSKRGRPPIFINESGFYSLVLSSKLESAKKFKKWVTSQILPSIPQEERFHFGVFSEKLKLTKSSAPSLITFNCDIKFPKGFLSL